MRTSRILTFLLLAMLLLQPAISFISPVSASTANSCNAKNVPADILPCNDKGLPFDRFVYDNYENLIVYGYPSGPKAVSNNQFRLGFQSNPNDPLSINKSGGHYTGYDAEEEKTGKGEYRYLGYTYEGKLQTNQLFVNDASTSTSPGVKHWIYHPWDVRAINFPFENSDSKVSGLFDTNSRINQPESQFFATQVRQNLGFNFPNAIDYPSKVKHSDSNPLNYMYVQQQPTLVSSGAGIMWQLTQSHGIMYQTFPLEKLQGKQFLNLSGTATADAVCFDGKAATIPVMVKVNATLEDNAIADPIEIMKYYNRGDILNWTFTGLGQTANAPRNANKGQTTLSIDVPVSEINDAHQYIGSVNATVKYLDGKTQAITIPLTVQFDTSCGSGIKSLFEVHNDIQFSLLDDFRAGDVAYKDRSKGETINQYKIVITNTDPGGSSKEYTIHASHVADGDIETDLYDFMRLLFDVSGDSRSSPTVRHFKIDQTVYSDKESDTYTQNVTVTQLGKRPSPPSQPMQPDVDIPLEWFDIVPFPAHDYTDLSHIASRTVRIDGKAVDGSKLFSGNYVFGEDGVGWHYIQIDYVTDQGARSLDYEWTYIHNTKPNAQFHLDGLYKENRKLSATNQSDSADVNDQFVLASYPLSSDWEFGALDGSDSAALHLKTDTDLLKEMQYSKPGRYYLQLTTSNSLGRVSDPYRVEFEILPDEKPAIILHPFDIETVRGGTINLDYDVQSIDGDKIAEKYIDVYYDSDNDGTVDQLVERLTGEVNAYKPPADKLGLYELRAYAREDTEEAYYPEFMPDDWQRENADVEQFVVDNLRPFADLYLDQPLMQPKIDAFLMMDGNLAQSKTDYLKGNVVTFNNDLRDAAIDPVVGDWDMKVYTYSTPASTSKGFGGTYPPVTIQHEAGGYSGTLNRTSVSNNPYSVDEGHDESKTESQTFSSSCGNSMTKPPNGSWSSNNVCPGSVSINSNGYSGSIPRTGESSGSVSPDPCRAQDSCSRSWTAYYSGTLSKTVTVHVPNYVSYNSYTGFYSGTMYKDVRERLDNAFMRVDSDKYVVYFSDGIIKDLNDFLTVVQSNDAKLILVGPPELNEQVAALGVPIDNYIDNTSSIDQQLKDVEKWIVENNQATPRTLLVVGDTANLNTAESDPENDPLSEGQMEVVHDPDYFENPMGQDADSQSVYNPDGYGPEMTSKIFDKTGLYDWYRKVFDMPSTDPNFEDYSYESNEAHLQVVVHRIPIAIGSLDWDYDANGGYYHTSWIDSSFDLDHQFLRADKGIVDRKFKLTETGTGVTYTVMPSTLPPGAYHLEFVVKDAEGAWSNPFIKDFTLAATPPAQLKADLQPVDRAFTLAAGVPAGESLKAFNIWTRYPYTINLNHQMGSYINKSVPYYAGTKTGNDINWDDVISAIPVTTPDGTYNYRITATGQSGTAATKDFSVKVLTPINLAGTIDSASTTDASTIVVNEPITIKAATTEYPNQTTVILFKGTAKQKTLTLSGTTVDTAGVGAKSWSSEPYTVPAMADGTYTFEWTSRTPNGNVQTVTKAVKVVNNRPPTADFNWSPALIYEGDTVTFATLVGDPDRDSLAIKYELESPSGKRQTFSYTRSYPYSSAGPEIVTLEPGVWTATLTASDGKSPPVTVSKTFRVWPLTISGQVRHTDAWEANRLHYNEKHPEAKRPANWFWAGEAFVLEAMATDTGSSATKASLVIADAGAGLRKRLDASNPPARTIWTGTLGSANAGFQLVTLPEGDYTFTFTATYSNGVVKTTTATVHVEGTVDEYMQVHRVQ